MIGERRLQAVALVAIVLLALATRFYRLGYQSLWNDEGTSVALADRDLATITRNAAHDIHPPMYYYMLRGWTRLLGTSERGARSLSAIMGVLVVVGTYLLARPFAGRSAALWAALFSSVSPFQVYYSQEARMYVIVTLCSLLSMLSCGRLLRGWQEVPSLAAVWQWMASYILFSVLALYTQYYAFAILLAQNLLFLVWWSRPARLEAPMGPQSWQEAGTRRGQFLYWWVGGQVLILLFFVPWLFLAWDSLRGWPAVSQFFSLGQLLASVNQVFALGITVPQDTRTSVLALSLSLLVIPGLAHSFIRGRQEQSCNRQAWLLALYLVVPLLIMYLLSLQRPLYKPKFLLLATPPYYALQAAGVLTLSTAVGRLTRQAWAGRIVAGALALGVGVASAYSLYGLYFEPRYFRDDYRGIVEHIKATARLDDAILIDAPSQIETVGYYYRGPLPLYPLPLYRPLNVDLTRGVLEQMRARHERIYAILWATEDGDPTRFVEGWLEQQCYKVADTWYGDVRLAVYSVPRAPAGEIETLTDFVLGDQIRLLGYTLLTPYPENGEVLQLTLFWEALRPVAARYKVFVHLLDEHGNIVSQRDSEPGGGIRLTSDWQPGERVGDHYGLLIPPGTIPGAHMLRVGMYGLDDGRRLPITGNQQGGDSIDLASVSVLPASSPPPVSALDLQARSQARWGPLSLLGHSLYRLGAEFAGVGIRDQASLAELRLRPGDFAKLILFWRRDGPDPMGETWVVMLRDRRNLEVWRYPISLTSKTSPPAAWHEGQIARTIHMLPLPPALPAGTYRLMLRPEGWTALTPGVPESEAHLRDVMITP